WLDPLDPAASHRGRDQEAGGGAALGVDHRDGDGGAGTRGLGQAGGGGLPGEGGAGPAARGAHPVRRAPGGDRGTQPRPGGPPPRSSDRVATRTGTRGARPVEVARTRAAGRLRATTAPVVSSTTGANPCSRRASTTSRGRAWETSTVGATERSAHASAAGEPRTWATSDGSSQRMKDSAVPTRRRPWRRATSRMR